MSMMCRPKWPFLFMCVFYDVRHVEFLGLMGSQWNLGFWVVTFYVDIDNNALRYYFGSIFIFYFIIIIITILFNFIHFTLVLVTWSLLLFVCVFQEVNFSCIRRPGQGKLVPFDLEPERTTNRLHKGQR